jgi:hypothetical protein
LILEWILWIFYLVPLIMNINMENTKTDEDEFSDLEEVNFNECP